MPNTPTGSFFIPVVVGANCCGNTSGPNHVQGSTVNDTEEHQDMLSLCDDFESITDVLRLSFG